MGIFLDLKKANESKIKRLKYLPRIGVSVDVAGKRFLFKSAPITESIMNVYGKDNLVDTVKAVYKDPHALKGLTDVIVQQFSEIDLKDDAEQSIRAAEEKAREQMQKAKEAAKSQNESPSDVKAANDNKEDIDFSKATVADPMTVEERDDLVEVRADEAPLAEESPRADEAPQSDEAPLSEESKDVNLKEKMQGLSEDAKNLF